MYNKNLEDIDKMIELVIEQKKNFFMRPFYNDKEARAEFSYLGRELLKLMKARELILVQKLAWKDDARKDLASHSKAIELATNITEKNIDAKKVAENAEITNEQGREFGRDVVEQKAWREPWKS